MKVNIYKDNDKNNVLLLSKEPLEDGQGEYVGTLSNSTYLVGMPDKEIKEMSKDNFLRYLKDRKSELIHDLDETDEVFEYLVSPNK